jgi:hypothetical protein
LVKLCQRSGRWRRRAALADDKTRPVRAIRIAHWVVNLSRGTSGRTGQAAKVSRRANSIARVVPVNGVGRFVGAIGNCPLTASGFCRPADRLAPTVVASERWPWVTGLHPAAGRSLSRVEGCRRDGRLRRRWRRRRAGRHTLFIDSPPLLFEDTAAAGLVGEALDGLSEHHRNRPLLADIRARGGPLPVHRGPSQRRPRPADRPVRHPPARARISSPTAATWPGWSASPRWPTRPPRGGSRIAWCREGRSGRHRDLRPG